MLKIERTRDVALATKIITDPSVYPHVTDDGAPEPQDFIAVETESVFYLLLKEDEDVLGMWLVHPHNFITCSVHTCMLPEGRGKRGLEGARLCAAWVWENTQYRRIITEVPETNRLALAFAKKAGMEQFGVNPKSFQKNGTIQDIIMLGISSPEEPYQQH